MRSTSASRTSASRRPAGPHKVGVTFLHRTFAESEDKLLPADARRRAGSRAAHDARSKCEGPFEVTGISETPSRKKVFICYAEDGSGRSAVRGADHQTLATRAFRRPLTDAEKTTLFRLLRSRAASADGNFEAGIRRALTAVLASPYFLYRAEPAPQTAKPGLDLSRSTTIELASRLSFFLWSTVPDEELLKVAASGKLREPECCARR